MTEELESVRAHGRRSVRRRRSAPPRLLAVLAVVVAGAIAVPVAMAAVPETAASPTSAAPVAQSFQVPMDVVERAITRDSPTVTDQVAELTAGATNADWAKLVLVMGEFPTTDENVTVITRWMRQENYTDSWWQRNNPLNNGWGSGGGSGLGTYDSLVIAAENAAEALRTFDGYAEISASLDASASADATAAEIWASPWASSHYAYGAHWSEEPVPVIPAPADAWAAG